LGLTRTEELLFFLEVDLVVVPRSVCSARIARTSSLSVPFFFIEGGGRSVWSLENEGSPVVKDPAYGFTFAEVHRFGNGGGEVDVVLVCGLLPVDELNFGWVSHAMAPFCRL
jgi:hypothetical protein